MDRQSSCQQHFLKQKSGIYNSGKLSSTGLLETESQNQIQNLKEVLQMSSSNKFIRGSGNFSTQKHDSVRNSGDYCVNFDLPEDAAQRWMTNAQYQASQTMLRKHGGNYMDTKTNAVPPPRSVSQKVIDTNGNEPSPIE